MMSDLITAPVLLAMLGAIPTAIRSWARGKRGLWAGLSDALIGVALAASVADWVTPHDKPAVALLVGMVSGMAGAPAIDAVRELVPQFVRELLMGWARRLVGQNQDLPLDPPATVIDGGDEHE